MDLYQAIKQRRSVRQYKPDPVPESKVHKILDAANWAPSGMNQQCWKFYIVNGEKLASIAESYGKIVESTMPPVDQRDERMQSRLKFAQTFGGAPFLIIATMPKDERIKVHTQSVAAAFQNMLLAAHAEGLGTCWMMHPLVVADNIYSVASIPADEELFAVTPLGYPAVTPGIVARLDPELNSKVVWVK